MERRQILNDLISSGVIAVIRLSDDKKIDYVISSLSEGGVKALEITMTTPNAIDIIKNISKKNRGDFLVGVGSVLDPETANASIHSGAQFIVSPILNIDIIRMGHRYDRVVIPGAFTPTEIINAWESGGDIVKVFPATILGPKYFKDIHGPMPQVKLSPTGGVSIDNASDFIKAGAVCLGIGSALVNKKLIENSDWEEISKRASALIEEVKKGRESSTL
jgi:2-dehydro-3-deoxyphosphogluconate aldolase/(4S)-4-hydroxy-2-oxoglutarate aldolase